VSADDLRSVAGELHTLVDDIIERIANSPKGSIGSVDNTYLPQIGVETVERWRERLRAILNRPAEQSDADSLRELSNKLHYSAEYLENGTIDVTAAVVDMRDVRDTLNGIVERPAAPQPSGGRWISVKERMPEDFALVFVSIPAPTTFRMNGELVTSGCDIARFIGGRWYLASCGDDQDHGLTVSHWQPLPDPPSSPPTTESDDKETRT
jgi:uncharacterized protein DUF551